MHNQTLVKFDQFILKLLSANEILTSINGHETIINLRKLMFNNANLDLVNINEYQKFGHILSIRAKDIERKRNSDKKHGSSKAISLLLFNENRRVTIRPFDFLGGVGLFFFSSRFYFCFLPIENQRIFYCIHIKST